MPVAGHFLVLTMGMYSFLNFPAQHPDEFRTRDSQQLGACPGGLDLAVPEPAVDGGAGEARQGHELLRRQRHWQPRGIKVVAGWHGHMCPSLPVSYVVANAVPDRHI